MKDGGPAFPRTGYAHPNANLEICERADLVTAPADGMTLRDYFAGQAIEGIISRGLCQTSDFLIQDAVKLAYALANAMIASREK